MEYYLNGAQSTLSAPITSTSVTTFSVVSAATFPTTGSFRVLIDSEIIQVTGVSGGNFTGVRQAENTSATTHLSGATVYGVLTAGALNAFVSIQSGGTEISDRRILNFTGATITDDFTNNRCNITISTATGNVVLAPTTSATNIIQGTSATVIPLAIDGYAGQTAHLQEWQNSSGTALSLIDSNGCLGIGNGVTSQNAINLYYASSGGYVNIQGAAGTPASNTQQMQISFNNQAVYGGTSGQNSGANVSIYDQVANKSRTCLSNATGQFFIGTANTNGAFSVQMNQPAAANIPLVVQGYASQSADLQEWQSSGGAVLAKVSSSGAITSAAPLTIGSNHITFGSAAPSSGTWVQGDVCFNTGVTATTTPGWSCTTAGTPGTWTAWPIL